jgi:hypothetical protein
MISISSSVILKYTLKLRLAPQSAAGDYIDRILEHLDQINVREDGSTEVGHLIELRLGGWLRSIRAC